MGTFLLQTFLSAVAFLAIVEGFCYFNGKEYCPGESIGNGCFIVTCDSRGNWVTTNQINRICDRCYGFSDPYIITFDNLFYKEPYPCRYVMSEKRNFDRHLSHAPFGVYANFYSCRWRRAACFEETSFRLDPLLTINIRHASHTIIYDEYSANWMDFTQTFLPTPVVLGGLTYPALAWMFNGQLRILGPDFALQITRTSLFILTVQSHHRQLGGLCGFYDGDGANDRRDRFDQYPGEPQWILSWKTLYQKYCSCLTKDRDCSCSAEQVASKTEETVLLTDADKECIANEVRNISVQFKTMDTKFGMATRQFFIDAAAETVCANLEFRDEIVKTTVEDWQEFLAVESNLNGA